MDGNTEDLQKFVPQVHFEQIPIKNLCSNQDYQRNLSIKHVQRAAANFDLYQINPVKVSRRDGINYVFNGQHTILNVHIVPMPLPLIYIFHPYIRYIYNYYIVHINACSRSIASAPRISPIKIRSGRIRRLARIRSRIVIASFPSVFALRASSRTRFVTP